jgi:D-alanine-D-alanine ligase
MSAASVINALDNKKFEVVCIGITRQGDWKRFTGPASDIENGEWEKQSADFNLGELKKEIDFAFPVLHGPYGEDGTIQGLFEMADIPYAGCGVLASSLAMDKIMAKKIFLSYGLPICAYTAVLSEELGIDDEKLASEIERKLSDKYPLFVKPANMGSSVGINKAKNRNALIQALYEAAKYDRRLVIEEGINGRELEAAALGNIEIEASVVGEILPASEFYDYHTKYFDGGKSEIQVPAEISPEAAEEIRRLAIKAYSALDCAGFARVDFFMENKTNKIYINEINTIPGFTKYSMFPRLWRSAGITYSGLLERIVELGYEKHYAKNHRQTIVL